MTSAALKEIIFGDLERELKVTRKVLAALPLKEFDWKVHEKSMSLGQLAIHVATLPEWAMDALAHDVLDFATAPKPPKRVADTAELLKLFDDKCAGLRAAVEAFDPEQWHEDWTIRNGDKVFTTQQRSKVFRIWSLNHLVHHRAQLCVYLRLLGVGVPTVYFNTSDDPAWVFD
ncbi:MAG TPA: DinB family protein [Phycisphaerae bacterium]|nr:DinB family protein [Phycisphaerae bacterium]